MTDFPLPDPESGVFETLLVLDGAPVELDAHLARLDASVRELYGAPLPAGARALVLERAAGLAPGRLRLTAAPTAPVPDAALELDVATAQVDPEDIFPAWERATGLVAFHIDGWHGAHKWADRTGLAGLEARLGKGRLPLLLDGRDRVLEASRANVFAVDGETLLTPPADASILAGVARARVIEAARGHGIEVREETLTLERLTAAGAAFLTGSVRGVEPVGSVGDTALREPGDLTRRLAAELKQRWAAEAPARSRAGAG